MEMVEARVIIPLMYDLHGNWSWLFPKGYKIVVLIHSFLPALSTETFRKQTFLKQQLDACELIQVCLFVCFSIYGFSVALELVLELAQ